MPRSSHSLPPGPRQPRLLQTLQWLRQPARLYARCERRYGRIFTIRLSRLGDAVVVADPELVRQVFAGDPSVYRAGAANAAIFEPVAGQSSIVMVDGDEHMQIRRMLLPSLRPDQAKDQASRIVSDTESEIASWTVGRPFELRDSMEAITLEVILRTVLGPADSATVAGLRPLVPRIFNVSPLQGLAILFPEMRRGGGLFGSWRRWRQLMDQVDELILGEIERRRRGPLDPSAIDTLSTLLAARDADGQPLSDTVIRDQLVTLLVVGHETTATALAWAFERVLRNPATQARLVEELDAGDSGEFLDAVVRESLRTRPVLSSVARRLSSDVEIDGRLLPAGAVVVAGISLVQSSQASFPAPDEFRPERFLAAKPQSRTWIPFGGGVRRCAGANLALLQMRLVLATVFRQAELRAVNDAPERAVVRGVTLSPARGCQAVLERRRTSSMSACPVHEIAHSV